MRQYLDLAKHVLENGVFKGDRTGTGTYSVFGYQTRYDLSQGFPLVTTKKMFTRGVIGELLWFIEGSTSAKHLEEKYGVKFWREWADEDGELGPLYGKQFRNIEHSYWVEPLIYEPHDCVLDTPFSKEIVVDYASGDSQFIGKELDTQSGKATVIKQVAVPRGRGRFVVKFHDTGYEKEVPYGHVQSEMISDPYAITVFGVGRYGEFEEDEHTEHLKDIWREMLRRCYHKSSRAYISYGAKGVHVDKEWLTFANFNRDARKLTNWSCKIEYPFEYSLDKDVRYASNRYSMKTCMWSSKREQSYNTSTNRPFTAKSPDGEAILFRSVGEAKEKYGLNLSAIHRCLNGTLRTHHSWSDFQYAEREGMVLRTRVIDQLKEVVAEIKHNPNSRRLIISLYNPHELDKMSLHPCHGNMIQFYVINGKLSCHMYQRSGDLFLGVPVNIASYALLTMMVAQVCDLELGDFVHTLGDAHIYSNHVEQMKLQISREPYALPQMKINPEVKDIFGFKYEDFELVGYESHDAIKGEVAV